MSAVWTGKSVPVNRKNAIGRRGHGAGAKVLIRTTSEYQRFIDDMAICFSKLPKMGTKYVALYVHMRLGTRADADGVIKPIQDALERCGAVDNDFQIREHHIYAYIAEKRGVDDIIVVDLREIEWDPKSKPSS